MTAARDAAKAAVAARTGISTSASGAALTEAGDSDAMQLEEEEEVAAGMVLSPAAQRTLAMTGVVDEYFRNGEPAGERTSLRELPAK